MTEKELRKQLEQQKREMELLEKQYNCIKYAKQIDAFCTQLASSDALLELIADHHLSCDDAKALAKNVSAQLPDIYLDMADTFAASAKRRSIRNAERRMKPSSVADDPTPAPHIGA